MSVDLHLHTVHSDGSWTPEQLVEAAVALKLKTIAVTDHDTVDGISAAEQAANGRIEIIPGIEINTVYKDPSGRRVDVHVLGYFIDRTNAKLQRIMQRQQDARNQLVTDTIEKLNSLGVPMTIEHVQACVGKGSIGRPHLTKAIVMAGGAETINQGFERFMSRKSPDFIPRHSIEPYEAIEAINAAGGIASIAHPGKTEDIERIILELREQGLRAIEAFHRSHGLELVKQYMKFAGANDMLITGGSDCHGPHEHYPASIGQIRVPPDVVRNLKSSLAGAR